MSDKKQTAVEWLMEQISYENGYGERYNTFTNQKDLTEFFQQALAMEKEQIAKSVQWCLSGVMDEESALNEGHKFYNEAFNRAYGVDEPDYNNITIRNQNPDYKP
jgi:hypothetical protein